jgi:hypothetical protein
MGAASTGSARRDAGGAITSPELATDPQAPTAVRPGCLIGAGAIVLGFLIVVLGSVALMLRGAGDIDLGTATDYPRGSVVYRSTDGLLIVRQPDGAIVAFSDIDPHNPPGREDCLVTFRPDLAAGNEPGRFFDICSGSMYDLNGHGLAGDGLDLRQVPVEQQEDGRLKARPRD